MNWSEKQFDAGADRKEKSVTSWHLAWHSTDDVTIHCCVKSDIDPAIYVHVRSRGQIDRRTDIGHANVRWTQRYNDVLRQKDGI